MDAREKLNEFAELRGWDKNKLIGWSEAAGFGQWLVEDCSMPDVSGSFTMDDIRKAFEGGRDSVEAEIGYELYGDMEAYPKKKIVKSFKQWMHENYH